jgi:hypothetical protein
MPDDLERTEHAPPDWPDLPQADPDMPDPNPPPPPSQAVPSSPPVDTTSEAEGIEP